MNDTSAWIPVGDLADAFAPEANVLQPTDALAGRSLVLHFPDGSQIEHRFDSADRLEWQVLSGAEAGAAATETCRCTSLRDGIFFVDFVKSQERAMSVSLVLDLNRSIYTAVIGQLPSRDEAARTLAARIATGDELTAVTASILHGTIDRPVTPDTPRHDATDELIGRRVFYRYSPNEEYEHIYLNRSLYTWHCLKGIEAHLGDTDRCHYHKVGENLYLFVWREKIVPTLGIIMIDLDRGKTTGKIMGYAGSDFGAVSNFGVGAIARVLNDTTY